MTTERTGCETLDRAIALAPSVKVNPTDVTCPFLPVCDGTKCFVMDGKVKVEELSLNAQGEPKIRLQTSQDIFYAKLERTVERANARR